jgi:hypothetical protein
LTQTSRPFADTQTNASVFFIFFHRTFLIQFLADTHCTHLQATQADTQPKLAKECNLSNAFTTFVP